MLSRAGIDLKQFDENHSGVALYRQDAKQAIQALSGTNWAVLGGDVVRLQANGCDYTYDSWAVNPEANETVIQYLRRSWQSAIEYIDQYPDPEDNSIAYVLVINDVY